MENYIITSAIVLALIACISNILMDEYSFNIKTNNIGAYLLITDIILVFLWASLMTLNHILN